MKLIIAGTRTLKPSLDLIAGAIRTFGLAPTEIVSGMAQGVDTAGEKYAALYSLPLKPFPADWDTHQKAAGPIRNAQMADYADVLLLIWDGTSRGSLNMRTAMLERDKPVYEVVLKSHD